jgi:hypothetical protein
MSRSSSADASFTSWKADCLSRQTQLDGWIMGSRLQQSNKEASFLNSSQLGTGASHLAIYLPRKNAKADTSRQNFRIRGDSRALRIFVMGSEVTSGSRFSLSPMPKVKSL